MADSGAGMSAEVKASLFSKFASAGGVGLGMYLTQKQLREMGSILEVRGCGM